MNEYPPPPHKKKWLKTDTRVYKCNIFTKFATIREISRYKELTLRLRDQLKKTRHNVYDSQTLDCAMQMTDILHAEYSYSIVAS